MVPRKKWNVKRAFWPREAAEEPDDRSRARARSGGRGEAHRAYKRQDTSVEGLRQEDRHRLVAVHARDGRVALKRPEYAHEDFDGFIDDDDDNGGELREELID